MDVMIIGAAGMVGRKLALRLARDGALAGKQIGTLTLVDVVPPEVPADAAPKVATRVADLSAQAVPEALVALRPDVIFHLAAIVSGEAEADFEKGYRPRLVFTSSIAVFGAPFAEKIGDEFFSTPLTSYGTQKAICELLLADYSRRGFFDGIGIRLPTICVRPGAPNKAASGFFSNILREPLVGKEAVLPVSEDVRHWFASPRAAVDFLIHAAEIDFHDLQRLSCCDCHGGTRLHRLFSCRFSIGSFLNAPGRARPRHAPARCRRRMSPP